MSKHIFKMFLSSSNTKHYGNIPKDPPNGNVECRCGRQKCNSWPICGFGINDGWSVINSFDWSNL